jgi:SAM-dependent methyltransferase
MDTELDRINRDVMRSPRVLDAFARGDGWTDRGEAMVMRRVAAQASRLPILDIGVGAGRTLPYLRSLSDEYVAIDYLEEMVELTSSRFPDARIEHRDARDLSAFADDAFGLVLFSFNGIDGLAHEDRPKVFSAVERILRPGGLFAFSTHNLEHRCAGRPPWDRRRFGPANGLRSVIGSTVRLPRNIAPYRRLRTQDFHGDGWASLVDPAYNYGVVMHYVTLAEALREPQMAGLDAEVEAFTTSGERVEPGDDTSDSPWLHLIARKPAGAKS